MSYVVLHNFMLLLSGLNASFGKMVTSLLKKRADFSVIE